MKKVCKKCGAEVSLLVKGQMCKSCRKNLENEPMRRSVYAIPKDVSDIDDKLLLEALTHNFKVHSATGFKNENERENYAITSKHYKERFGKDFPKLQERPYKESKVEVRI